MNNEEYKYYRDNGVSDTGIARLEDLTDDTSVPVIYVVTALEVNDLDYAFNTKLVTTSFRDAIGYNANVTETYYVKVWSNGVAIGCLDVLNGKIVGSDKY